MMHGIYSAGGFAREVKPSLALAMGLDDSEIVFVDDAPQGDVNGSPVLTLDEFSDLPNKRICVAFADPKLRRRKVEAARQRGLEFFSVAAPTHIRGDGTASGEGCIFAEHTMLTANCRVGAHVHLNIYAYVAHDCIVGDFVTLSPRVSLNGRIKVEDGVYIGSDATFLPGRPNRFLTIGEGAVIGAGAVVTKDVEPGAVVVGNPAKPRQ